MAVSSPIRSPYTRPVLPRTSSVMSGFFFWGMMDEPVENWSARVTKRNSQLHHRQISSEKRDRCIISMDRSESSSSAKSRSETPSRLFRLMPLKPSCSATYSRSRG